MSKLEVQNLNKTYSPKVVPVKDMSFTVEDGEFLTLVGPSGCGKSTTLRMVAGLEQPTHGRVIIGGKDVTSVSAGDRNIAMVFQSYALYPHMTVYENMASGLKLRDMPKSDIDERIVEATDILGIEGLLNRKPAKLSGGQRQRVALGRALVRRPAVFLLDEPLSNLDALLREQVRADLKQIFEAQSTPVVYVTHDQTEAMTLSTKVAVLYNGEIQQIDSPAHVYNRPANRFVAGFIGSPQMNLLTLNCEENKAVLGDSRLTLPDRFVPPPEVVLGVRPENVRIATPDDTETIEGRVFLEENLGMSNLISVRVKNSDLTLRALLPSDQEWSEDIRLALPVNRRHWFNVQTGERLPDAVPPKQQRVNANSH
jgi:multiple sugar transport system ATP-binding protein